MENWVRGFRPNMVIFAQPYKGDETAMVVQAVCADRVFRVRYKIAVKNAKGDKTILKLLR